MALSEKQVRKLMESDAYLNNNNKNYEKVNREVRQGFENLYPDDDRNENPSNYYVWRTKGDDRVRSKHAEREGEVFCWNNPPEGGHPGEDYNCRCWAEPYVPPKKEKSTEDSVGMAETENYMSFGDRALAAMSGIFGISKANAKEVEVDAVTSAAKPKVRNLLERIPSNGKDDYLLFDGFKLTWYRNDKPLKSWKAMSGNKKYQDKKYTSTKNVGPLPEGTWNVNQDRYQNYNDQGFWRKPLNYTKYVGFNKGQWSGGKPAWGNHRVWLEPAEGTDKQGRTDLSIHGGWAYGSAGCIDLADGMDDFADTYRKHGKNMKLKVKYSPNFGK